jgi:hypothetical protein
MVKHIYPFILFLSFTINLFAQEEAIITTKFSQDGVLYATDSNNSESIAEFKENEKCIVTSYLGNYTYKVKYKDYVGFVKDQYLFVNEQMMDLYFDHEEAQRLKAIAEREARQKKLAEIANKANAKKTLIEQRKKDSITAIEAEANRILMEKKRNDSIAKAKVETERLLALQKRNDSIAKAKANEERLRLEQAKKDSLAKVALEQKRLLAEKQKQDSIAKAKEQAEKLIALRKRNDSIIKAEKEAQEKSLELLRKRNDSVAKAQAEQKALDERNKQNAFAKAEAEKQKKLELLRKRNDSVAKAQAEQKAVAERKKQDSVARVKETQQKALELLRKRNDSVAKAKAEQKALAAAKQQNKFNKSQEIQTKLLLEKRVKDSIAQAIEQERKELQKLKRQNDSIAQVLQQERIALERLRNNTNTKSGNTEVISNSKEENLKQKTLLERTKFRDSCLYQINEYDKFYNITTIRTEPYSLSKDLTVELYKQGRKTDVFFNLTEDLGCASYLPNQRSSVRITLENDRTIAFYHSWDIECGEVFLFKARLSETHKEILKTSPIKSIELRGTENSKTIYFVEYKEFFMDKLKCLE